MSYTNSVVSYCIYGNIAKYFPILLQNIGILKELSFHIIIFCERKDKEEIEKVFPDVSVMVGDKFGIKNKMLWRLNPMFMDIASAFFVRDADSLITIREIFFMKQFLNSDKEFHIIRDHPLHFMPIMGGLFGLKSTLYKRLTTKNIFMIGEQLSLLYSAEGYCPLESLILATPEMVTNKSFN